MTFAADLFSGFNQVTREYNKTSELEFHSLVISSLGNLCLCSINNKVVRYLALSRLQQPSIIIGYMTKYKDVEYKHVHTVGSILGMSCRLRCRLNSFPRPAQVPQSTRVM
jgi:hypothetical protein